MRVMSSEFVRTFLLMTNISPSDWSYEIEERRQLIGRADEAEIRIPRSYQFVSRRHAQIWCNQKGIWISDVGSRSGTRVNGVWVEHLREASVEVGDRISLGDLELAVVSSTGCHGFAKDKLASARLQNADRVALRDESPKKALATFVHARMERLTSAEMAVVLWMCRGHSTDEDIAHKLHRSPHTVRTQIGSILQKLEQHSRLDVVNWVKQMEARLLSMFDDDDPSGNVSSGTRVRGMRGPIA